MKMIGKVGKSLDEKLKSGEIKESELMEEASEFLKKMNDVPGMKNMSSMFKSMGMPMGKGKMNVNAMQSHMQQNIKMSKMKERMRAKLEKRRADREAKTFVHTSFTNNSKMEKSSINPNEEVNKVVKRKKKKKKKKKKKNNN